MVTRVLALTIVLAMTLAVTTPTPAFAQPDFNTAKPIPGYPEFEITDKGWIIQGGDLAWGKCSTLLQETDEHTGDPDQVQAARACEKAGFSEKGSEVKVATVMETTMVNGSPVPVPIPSSGGPAILLPAAALLLGSGILTYAILRRR
jgi:hypothetical protein